MEAHGEPKITWRYAAQVSRHFLTIAFSFLSIATAITIIGLAADNINWGTGRGTPAANTVTTVFLGYDNKEHYSTDRWVTKMLYLPIYYDTPTFAALIGAAGIAVLGGIVTAPLSIVYWKSTGRSIELGRARRKLSQRRTLMVLLILETIATATTLIVLICVRELYTTERGYNRYDESDAYTLRPEYLDPPLPAKAPNTTYEDWDATVLDDDVFRIYWSPMHYNPLNWNCRLQGHVSSNTQHRLFQLCEEGNAARWLLVVLLLLQVSVLASHAWAWVEEKRSGSAAWTTQRLGSEVDVGRTGESE